LERDASFYLFLYRMFEGLHIVLTPQNLLKYSLEGMATCVAMHLLTGRTQNYREIILVGLTAGVTFMILDVFAPSIGAGARQGAGFGLGAKTVGLETFENFDEGFEQQADAFEAKDHHPETADHHSETADHHSETADHRPETADHHEASHQSDGYKLIPGSYSHRVVLPGYNADNIRAANILNLYHHDEPANFNESRMDSQQGGGTEKGALVRDKVGIYSGDIVNVFSGNKCLQRGLVNSQVVFKDPLPEVTTNLSKLRLVHSKKHDPTQQTVLNYGDEVYLMHNALHNNHNKSFYVKYGDRLQSHQTGPMFNTYVIFDAKDNAKKGPIDPDGEVIIARADETTGNRFLKINKDNTVSPAASQKDASVFNINIVRVYEVNNRNLCVCPDDILFP